MRKLIVTDDGSHSIEWTELSTTYHSVYGAIRESQHVFIEAGLHYQSPRTGVDDFYILEVGFGTGLNTLLTLISSEDKPKRFFYHAIDLFPLEETEFVHLNYCEHLKRPDLRKAFEWLHKCAWDEQIVVSPNFVFSKSRVDLLNFDSPPRFHLVYFDAFDPKVQPELWTEQVFTALAAALRPGGVLVTYSSKGAVRRALEAAGLHVQKLPGPVGKREIIRATRF